MAVISRPAGPTRQAKRHGGIDEIAHEYADGRTRDHAGQDELPGQAECVTSRLAIRIMTPMLSSISPKKALMSPR